MKASALIVAILVGGFVAYLAGSLMVALGVPLVAAVIAGGGIQLVAVGAAQQASEKAELRRLELERERALAATHRRMNADHRRSG